jgi:hypothetical protein
MVILSTALGRYAFITQPQNPHDRNCKKMGATSVRAYENKNE